MSVSSFIDNFSIRKVQKVLILSFIGPFIATFFVSVFVFLMIFVWKYIDDMVGKGLDFFVIARLLVYQAVTIMPIALPLAMLLSSLMTFGNFAEHFELTACKSAGMSLLRVMKPLIVVAVILSVSAFYFSNYILPVVNLKSNALLWDITQQKPALNIKEGVFYNGIEGYVIKVSKKDNDGQTLHGIMIYDHTANLGNTKLILADHGKMFMSEDERSLILNLIDGSSFEEQQSDRSQSNSYPFLRSAFKQETIRFDLSGLKFTRTKEELFKDNFQVLNIRQLAANMDTITKKINRRKKDFEQSIAPYYSFNLKNKNQPDSFAAHLSSKNFIMNFDKNKRSIIMSAAMSSIHNISGYIQSLSDDIAARTKTLHRNEIEWHRKFTLSFACLVLFFIGAPLGAIIRKGGIGMPVVVSALFFIVFHILSITGEKLSRDGMLPAHEGMWIASVILFPVGIFLTYKAATDSLIFDKAAYAKFFRQIFRIKKSNPVVQ